MQSVSYTHLDVYKRQRASWARYIFGVCREMIKRGVDVKGFNTAFSGDVPLGAGTVSYTHLTRSTRFFVKKGLSSTVVKWKISWTRLQPN